MAIFRPQIQPQTITKAMLSHQFRSGSSVMDTKHAHPVNQRCGDVIGVSQSATEERGRGASYKQYPPRGGTEPNTELSSLDSPASNGLGARKVN